MDLVARDPTGWFDGAALTLGQNSGAGGIIRFFEHKIYKWYFNCGQGTNTREELLGVWALLTLIVRLDISELSVHGDSKIVIDWLRGKGHLQVFNLECWKDIILDLIKKIHSISFQHVYREDNTVANTLSKQALLQPLGKIGYY